MLLFERQQHVLPPSFVGTKVTSVFAGLLVVLVGTACQHQSPATMVVGILSRGRLTRSSCDHRVSRVASAEDRLRTANRVEPGWARRAIIMTGGPMTGCPRRVPLW